MKQWFERNCSWVLCRTSSTQDAPDARPTTTVTDVPFARESRPLPVSLAQKASRVDGIVDQPSTVPGPTGIGENIGHTSCVDRHGINVVLDRYHNPPLLNGTPGTIGGMFWILE